jgi:probable F420-dependent oxidoreductase
MRVGIQAPYFSDDPVAVRDFVQIVEALDYDSIWLPDHIVVPGSIQSSYPYDLPSARRLFADKHFLSATTTAAFIAGISMRLTIGFGVLVLPLRQPVDTAKQLATIDVLSSGRLIVGVGAGWLEEEFRALGVPFESRGARLDEYVQLLRVLWGPQPISFGGRFWSFDELFCEPRPPRSGGPPIWIGGHSPAALKRCARLGDGWFSVELAPEAFREKSAALEDLIVAAGRRPEDIKRAANIRLRLSDNANLDEATKLLVAFRESGCDHLVVSLTATQTVAANIQRIRTLAQSVMPAITL